MAEKKYPKLSELTTPQKGHLVWRLDAKTSCGLLTAQSVARGEHGDLNLVDVFEQYGSLSNRSAKIHSGKILKYQPFFVL